MKILITGSQGLVGSYLYEHLKRAGHLVIGMDLFDGKVGNIAEWSNWMRAARDFDFIINTASLVKHSDCENDPLLAYHYNVTGVVNILEFIRRYSPDTKLIHFSSVKFYATNGLYGAYGISKHVSDEYVQEYIGSYGVKATILRPGCIAGINNKDHGFLNQIASCIAYDKEYKVNGDGSQLRDNIHLRDVARIVELIVNDQKNGIYDIGGGKENAITVKNAIKTFQAKLGKQGYITEGGVRKADADKVVVDMSKFRSDYEFTLECNLDFIINELYEYYKNATRIS